MDAIKQYLRLCWFDINPLTLPKSTGFLRTNLLFYVIVQYFLQTNMTDDPFESVTEVLVEIVLILLFIAVVLIFDRKIKTYLHVCTAILFCTNVLSILFIPIIVWLTVTDAPLSYYCMSLLVLWLYALITYIFHKSLMINLLASSAITFFYIIVVYVGALSLGQL